jgi:hypothetical protein
MYPMIMLLQITLTSAQIVWLTLSMILPGCNISNSSLDIVRLAMLGTMNVKQCDCLKHYLCIEWALVGLSFTRENKLLIFLVDRGRACCSRLQNV